MSKTPADVARQVLDAVVDERDVAWWRGRAITLALEFESSWKAGRDAGVAWRGEPSEFPWSPQEIKRRDEAPYLGPRRNEC